MSLKKLGLYTDMIFIAILFCQKDFAKIPLKRITDMIFIANLWELGVQRQPGVFFPLHLATSLSKHPLTYRSMTLLRAAMILLSSSEILLSQESVLLVLSLTTEENESETKPKTLLLDA